MQVSRFSLNPRRLNAAQISQQEQQVFVAIMSTFDETAGSPVAGPSSSIGRLAPADKKRTKKRTRQSKSSGDVGIVDTPTASSSQAVYVPPASEVKRYARGKAASTKTVGANGRDELCP